MGMQFNHFDIVFNFFLNLVVVNEDTLNWSKVLRIKWLLNMQPYRGTSTSAPSKA